MYTQNKEVIIMIDFSEFMYLMCKTSWKPGVYEKIAWMMIVHQSEF